MPATSTLVVDDYELAGTNRLRVLLGGELSGVSSCFVSGLKVQLTANLVHGNTSPWQSGYW